MLDEFGLMLQSITGAKSDAHLKQIMSNFMELYSTAGSVYNGTAYSDRKKSPNHRIVDPCAVVYGTSTHESFYKGFTSSEAVGGGIARFIIIDAGIERGTPVDYEKRMPDQSLVSYIKDFDAFYPSAGNLQSITIDGQKSVKALTVYMTQEVKEAWHDLDVSMTEKMTSDAAASIYSRVAENAAKLALTYAVSVDYRDPVIDFEAFKWGTSIAIWSANVLMDQMRKFMADNEHERRTKATLAFIEDAGPGGVTKSQITNATLFWRKGERDDFIQDMLESGHIVEQKIDTGGRPKTVFVHLKKVSK
jgi:hypothetical protein